MQELTCLGASIPGFFADQSTETLDYMVKNSYYTSLWTAHVFPYFYNLCRLQLTR
jgi:hypothetical protein